MIEMIRYCPDCGRGQPFEQQHPPDGGCPDAADGNCPEWSCAGCGAALLIGFLRYQREPAEAEQPRRLVA